MDPTISILPDEAQWRSRMVRYYAGGWEAVRSILPEFELVPFKAGDEEPANPFLRMVMRQPMSRTERPMPVGIVSNSYSLASHAEVAALCRKGIVDAGVDPDTLHYEVGLSELGEWMNFRIYLKGMDSFIDKYEEKLGLRLECFNSVDGSSRLVVLFGWLRFVCSNGLVIGETKIEIKERHGQALDIAKLPERIRPALDAVQADRDRMSGWQDQRVSDAAIKAWVDEFVAGEWGKKAAMRVFHICGSGWDVEVADPFAAGLPSEKPVRKLLRVPGSPERADTKYDVSQALSYLATRRKDPEERVALQTGIPRLLAALHHEVGTHA